MTTSAVLCKTLPLALVLLGACSRNEAPAAAPHGAAASAPAAASSAPPVSVTTVTARRQRFEVQLQATGTVVPVNSVDVKPQSTSVITQVLVKEGQFVKAGQPLFVLDARADQANVARLQAQMARDEAALADARRQLGRSQDLLRQNFVSQGAVDTSRAQVEAQTALVASDRAAVDAARVALGYARITAPNAGRVGAVTVFAGSAVQANATTLVTITQLDPIDIAFALPQRYLPDMLEALKNGGATVRAALGDSRNQIQGRLRFVDNAVDAATGTVKVKARFDNAGQTLWPGAFARVLLMVQTLDDAVVIPLAAVVTTQRGAIAYAAVDGKAQIRPLKVLASQGEEAAVSGIQPGERIVLEGRQNLRPGAALVERAGAAARGASGAASGARRAASAGSAP